MRPSDSSSVPQTGAAHIAFNGGERLGLCGCQYFVAQSHTPSDCCVRFAAVGTFRAATPGIALATAGQTRSPRFRRSPFVPDDTNCRAGGFNAADHGGEKGLLKLKELQIRRADELEFWALMGPVAPARWSVRDSFRY
jgi:hypothetical protein